MSISYYSGVPIYDPDEGDALCSNCRHIGRVHEWREKVRLVKRPPIRYFGRCLETDCDCEAFD